MSIAYRIRRGRDIDAAACAALHAEAFVEAPPPWSKGSFERSLADPSTSVIGAFDAQSALLGLSVWRRLANEAELLTICVARRVRRNGIGAVLLRETISEATSSECVDLVLEVSEANEAALSMYRHSGFVDIGRREGYYRFVNRRPAAAIILSKSLIEPK